MVGLITDNDNNNNIVIVVIVVVAFGDEIVSVLLNRTGCMRLVISPCHGSSIWEIVESRGFSYILCVKLYASSKS